MSLSPSPHFIRLWLHFLGTVLGLAMFAPIGHAATSDGDVPLIIQVRSDVDQPFEGLGKAELIEHGKNYALVSIEEMPGEEALIKPVNEAEMLKALHGELAKKGFQRTTAELKPDIAITVNYGRGWQRNPYLDEMQLRGSTDMSVSDFVGFERKLQNANFEKLYIHIMAWEYPQEPPPPGFKPKLLWKTSIITDSPEDRDFNLFFPKMLAAGADFFDRKTETIEAEIRDDMPKVQVILGDAKALKDGEASLELQSNRKQPKRVK